MATKRPHRAGKGAHSTGDNFRAITGVSNGVESCLHRAGILTYAQFASLSPDDIITIVGNVSALSPERIAKQNWIGQARALALRITSEETSAETSEESSEVDAPDTDEQHAEKFTVELFLDDNKVITLTRVTHTQTGEREQWGGWREERLVRFFARQAQSHELEALRVVARGEGKEQRRVQIAADQSVEAQPYKPAAESAPRPRSHNMEVLAATTGVPSRLLRHDQPFDVQLNLDLAGLEVSGEESVAYSAVLNARYIGSQDTQISRRVNGKIERPAGSSIAIKGFYLQPGSYVLDALITFGRPGKGSTKSGPFNIRVESSFIQVY